MAKIKASRNKTIDTPLNEGGGLAEPLFAFERAAAKPGRCVGQNHFRRFFCHRALAAAGLRGFDCG